MTTHPSAASAAVWAICLAFAALACLGCDDDAADAPTPEPTAPVIAVMTDLPPGGQVPLSLRLAADKINAGRVALGQAPIETRTIDLTGLDTAAVVEAATAQMDDPAVVGIIGPTTSAQLLAVAPVAIEREVVIASYSSTSADVVRAFTGSPFLWRTRLSDLVQAQWLVHRAKQDAVATLGLVVGLDTGGASFFDWFGYSGIVAGFTPEQLVIETFGAARGCADAVEAMLASDATRVIIAPGDAAEAECLLDAFHAARDASGALPVEVVLADTGVDLPLLFRELGPVAQGVSGWAATFEPRVPFDVEWAAFTRSVGQEMPMPTEAPAAHDAFLLLAYGLQASGDEGGIALATAIQDVVAGRTGRAGPSPMEIEASLAALAAGARPSILGVTGPLTFDAVTGIDPVAGTLAPFTVGQGLEFGEVVRLGEEGGALAPALLRPPSADSFRAPPRPEAGEGFTPPTAEATRRLALIVSASSGFDNYRHQADALARYQRLKAAGLTDDDIVMIGADDLAGDPSNLLPGVVRNAPGGTDVYAAAQYDYPVSLELTDQIAAILAGEPSELAPAVLNLDAETDLYVFLVGHGGLTGIGVGAETVDAGVLGGAAVYTPGMLRESLCALRAAGAVRRVLVEVETCYGGVFGDADFDGVEAGCDDGPLDGVLVMTAASTRENSLGAGYDADLGVFVGDQFARAVLDEMDGQPAQSLLDLYRGVYLKVSGSHASLYNAAHFGDVEAIRASDFIPPAP